MAYAKKQLRPLTEVVVLDEYAIDTIIASLPEGGYEHPLTHPATMITSDSARRFVTDAEKATWNTYQKNSDITKEEIEAKLTGEISSHTHSGSGGLTQAQIRRIC